VRFYKDRTHFIINTLNNNDSLRESLGMLMLVGASLLLKALDRFLGVEREEVEKEEIFRFLIFFWV
jgi:hypothetical protein